MEPQEAATKKSAFAIPNICTYFNKTLFTFKLFYFFFFAAFGSMFPLMSVYFKQMGMTAAQCGLLVGFRSLVDFFSAPFWGGLADKWKRGKTFLLCSLIAWIVFVLVISVVKPKPFGCLVLINNTRLSIKAPQANFPWKAVDTTYLDPINLQLGQSPIKLDAKKFHINMTNQNYVDMVIPRFSTIVFDQLVVNRCFLILLLIMVIGEFFSSPAISLADSAVINYLQEDTASYGKQRMYGSLGWGLSMFFIGNALDRNTYFPNHPCGHAGTHEKNYSVLFGSFAVLMSCAFLTATQFLFTYESGENMPLTQQTNESNMAMEQNEEVHEYGTVKKDESLIERPLESQADQTNENTTLNDAGKLNPQLRALHGIREWCGSLRVFGEPRLVAFLFVTWFMGFGAGIIFTFLFWHLQDLNGYPTLFGLASIINHFSEILAYFFSHQIIEKIGHIKVLYLGLIGNVVRFLYVSWLKDPVWILPFELVQGLTHAAVWAACCSYVTQAVPLKSRASAQGILQGIHHGLGKGLGAVIGGYIMSSLGSTILFRSYGVCCCIVLLLFVILNYYLAEKSTSTNTAPNVSLLISTLPGDEAEPKEVLEGGYLAPHGVPFAPIRRDLSHHKLNGETGVHSQSQSPRFSTENYHPQPKPFSNSTTTTSSTTTSNTTTKNYQSGYGY